MVEVLTTRYEKKRGSCALPKKNKDFLCCSRVGVCCKFFKEVLAGKSQFSVTDISVENYCL